MGSPVALRTSCINSINKFRGAAILRKRSLICLDSHTYQLLRHIKRNCKWRITWTRGFSGIETCDELSELDDGEQKCTHKTGILPGPTKKWRIKRIRRVLLYQTLKGKWCWHPKAPPRHPFKNLEKTLCSSTASRIIHVTHYDQWHASFSDSRCNYGTYI